MDDNWVDKYEAAKILYISHHTVLKLAREKRLRHVKIGKKCMFKRATLEAFLLESETKCK